MALFSMPESGLLASKKEMVLRNFRIETTHDVVGRRFESCNVCELRLDGLLESEMTVSKSALQNSDLVVRRETKAEDSLPNFDFGSSARTLAELLRIRRHSSPDKEVFHFVETTLGSKVSLTYDELYTRASGIAARLDVANPDRKPVLLLYPCNLDYLVAFFGCILGGHIAVPAYPPTATKHFDRLETIVKTSDARCCLVGRDVKAMMAIVDRDKLRDFSADLIETDAETDARASENFRPANIQSEDIAFLQFTSGSTGAPKGVMLSHRALLANLAMMKMHYSYTPRDRFAMWLPLYHDMGLIGGVLSSIYADADLYFLPPMSIVRPIRWLTLMSEVKATVSAAPNFAFDMCLNRVADADLAKLDLSSLRVLGSGAEPVRPETVRQFQEKFLRAGLKPNGIVPCYGLAEACVWGMSQDAGSPIRSVVADSSAIQRKEFREATVRGEMSVTYVSCGRLPIDGSAIVVDTATGDELGAGRVGELYISGRHLMSGYWNDTRATQEAFAIRNGVRYLRTGDLVFFDRDENVYFCGRNKDVIIIRGKNYCASDLEVSATLSSDVLKGMINAAFSFDEKEVEISVLVQEVPDFVRLEEIAEIQKQIQSRLMFDHALQFDRILFVEPGTIKRTSAGKVRRSATKDDYLGRRIKTNREIAFPRRLQKYSRKIIRQATHGIVAWASKSRAAQEFAAFRVQKKR
jgi:acyl-CoA synthetase (AMP-forming)/AMP-acid ligase II